MRFSNSQGVNEALRGRWQISLFYKAGERIEQTKWLVPVFNLDKAVNIYEGVCPMASAWGLVPKTVVPNRWSSTYILAPHQKKHLIEPRGCSTGLVQAFQHPFQEGLFESDRANELQKFRSTKEKGSQFLESLGLLSESLIEEEQFVPFDYL